jgi:anti-sigma factor RsiW
MNCHEARQHWMLYLDSEGDPELHFRISDHLGMCPDCAAWFARQQRFEQALAERLAAGEATPRLWERALVRAGALPPAAPRRRRLLFGGLAGAAAVLLGVGVWLLFFGRPAPSELANSAAEWHEQLVRGDVRPEILSTSDKVVEEQLRKRVSFPVHCPPRKDVKFDLRGAGVCRMKGREAAYIVGQVDQVRVSIFVLARSSLAAFPHDAAHFREGAGRHRCCEREYQMVSGVTADNVVVVIGKAPTQALEKLLTAYGSYHEDT